MPIAAASSAQLPLIKEPTKILGQDALTSAIAQRMRLRQEMTSKQQAAAVAADAVALRGQGSDKVATTISSPLCCHGISVCVKLFCLFQNFGSMPPTLRVSHVLLPQQHFFAGSAAGQMVMQTSQPLISVPPPPHPWESLPGGDTGMREGSLLPSYFLPTIQASCRLGPSPPHRFQHNKKRPSQNQARDVLYPGIRRWLPVPA